MPKRITVPVTVIFPDDINLASGDAADLLNKMLGVAEDDARDALKNSGFEDTKTARLIAKCKFDVPFPVTTHCDLCPAASALAALNDNSWLDDDPSATEDLAKAKAFARAHLPQAGIALTKEQAEARNALSLWTFKAGDENVSARAMTENQARMFAARKSTARIGELLHVTT
jgi:hypothetical protein